MNLTLSDEQRALQETAADFLAEQGNARKEAQADADAGLWPTSSSWAGQRYRCLKSSMAWGWARSNSAC